MNKQSRLSPAADLGSPFPGSAAKPYGNDPLCEGCGKGKLYSCICPPWPEDEAIPHVDYVDRVMGMLSPGWSRVEL